MGQGNSEDFDTSLQSLGICTALQGCFMVKALSSTAKIPARKYKISLAILGMESGTMLGSKRGT